jgi:fructuronate reductase
LTLTDKSHAVRLSATNLPAPLPYDRSRITPGMVHLGVGAFHRAHVASYVDEVLRIDPSWGIIGASLRRPDTRYALAPQNFLYTLVIRSGAGAELRVIGSILDVLDAATQRNELIAWMANPNIRVVSLTVTEKGYCHDPATGALNPGHPDIVHDLAHPEAPVSAPGLMARALELRRAAGIAPFTVLCCDNLPANGETTRRILTEFASMRDRRLADHIAGEVAFPSTMVDRIVPATTAADRRLVYDQTNIIDAWPAVTEPFMQWVIEDRFSASRPPLEYAGAEFVADVRPFELMKLRMLNGSHSLLAYLGLLAGYRFVNEAIADPTFHAFVHDFMTKEVIRTLPQELGDLSTYRDALLDRFANPALMHRLAQIAMDGSQKLPQRLLGTIRDCVGRALSIEHAALGVAAWMRYATGFDERGDAIEVSDPLAEKLLSIAKPAAGSARQLVDGLLSISEIFGNDLPQNNLLRATLDRQLTSLFARGARKTACDLVDKR